ncbi:nuclear transport factor 2 family protein [Flavobacterium phycosphaerae]|uniref:nuclear transport factor 2 family protein n=1 Tax=Flavobacterium phycosphaerae TaxID=2697515 RepID=UPI00138B0CAD|nr:nuclear transport factor 2 family protein [Flavobacterium phycosphaerae]
MSAKEIVQKFYQSDVLLEPDTVKEFLHPEVILEWHSTRGFLKLKKTDILALSSEFGKAYVRSKSRITHIIAEDNLVSVRYSHYVKTIENPREEMLLAHFMVIWELKGNKLYRGYQMSQL